MTCIVSKYCILPTRSKFTSTESNPDGETPDTITREWVEKSKVGASGQRLDNVALSFTKVMESIDNSKQGIVFVTSSQANSIGSGSGSGSGRSHATNRAKNASVATQSTQQISPPILSVCVFLFFIVVNFKGYDFIRRRYDFL